MPRRYEQRLRAEGAEETRRRILEAVYARLHDAPAEPVSVDLVAREARVARSTVYLVFGSRAGLFDALADDLMRRAGFGQIVRAVHDPDAREHLRGGIRAGIRLFARERDVLRVLFSMAALDPDAVGGAIGRVEENRAGGMAYLVERLAAQDILRPGLDTTEAADMLWLLTSFDSFDVLFTGRRRSAEEIADLFVATAERTLCR